MYIVTGGAGFIGANLVHALNGEGINDILVVDNLTNSAKHLNLTDLDFADYMDKVEFREAMAKGRFDNMTITAVFHQGACSDTMEYNGRYMMDNNYTYSKELYHFCASHKAPFIYASSAATYGDRTTFVEARENENPLNVYGYSKLLFDRYMEKQFATAPMNIAGLRYFNVYGSREQHKGRMASMVHQLYHQIRDTGEAKLFEGSGGYGNGEQRRDFISVDDVIAVNLFLARTPGIKGIFNVGTGESRSFNDIANTLIKYFGKGEIRYRAMPDVLKDKYQNFTEADISRLRKAGFDHPFTSLEDGVTRVAKCLSDG